MSMLPADAHRRLERPEPAVITREEIPAWSPERIAEFQKAWDRFTATTVCPHGVPRRWPCERCDYPAKTVTLENDCEDQGVTKISDGCTNWKCAEWDRLTETKIRPALVKRGGFWVCPKCGGGYGPAS